MKKVLDPLPHRSAAFIEPMECLVVPKLPDGSQWIHEIKLDGYRALGIKSDRGVRLRSRRNNSFNRQYPLISEALSGLPEDSTFCLGYGGTNESCAFNEIRHSALVHPGC